MKASYEKKGALIVILVLIVLGVVRYCDDSIVVRNHPRKEFVSVKKIETRIVGYEEYIDQAQKRIKALNETASLAKMVGDRESALAFMKYMEKPKPSCPFFSVDASLLDVQQKKVIEKWENEMFLVNAATFILMKKACKKVVDADGYGDDDVRSYYTEKWNEIKNGVPVK